MRLIHSSPLALGCAALIALAGCGSSDGGGGATSPNARAAPASSPQLVTAASPTEAEFPQAGGKTLQQLADTMRPGPQLGLATSVYTPGTDRLAFGLIDGDNKFVYGRTAVYIAKRPGGPAQGPFLAPADSLEVRTAFRSQTSNSTAGELKAVYHATVDFPRAGRWYVLSATRLGDQLYGATADVKVGDHPRIPAAGDSAPRVDTPTPASVGNDVSKIDTRTPPSEMHRVSLRDVLGKKPVVLLFATPALCQSRVCGPVADIGAQLQAAYGDRVEFIHNEVYVDNDPSKGLRPQLTAYGLTTEPWLFAIARDGRVVERLEGAFGIEEYRQAVEKAERGS
ncbi:hypothetical protein Q5424_07320 [Conexibacter sp. JD483]|uniref:TlpA family protein disulfide reductase n=1 Tax=unclassified Conexibacter TaxID=2627773 RepID=UPI002723873A|nr:MULTISPECIES: hypothetical protein [unclassified Conexibacter]MDO8187145.1 hypothetical protein [Conexibacter sp. CPCC 205706]MDO8200321.1 hypothetical protein [Conexibacter sp. CPCC 205762]MDR9368883.1 hypothetical protein [Conexibacter sp. JD483]